MSPAPVIDGLQNGDESAEYVRRVIPSCLTRNLDDGSWALVPHKTFVFNPDLSIHSVPIIVDLGSTVEAEYIAPPNWILSLPITALLATGAFLKATPHADESVLGPAHHSIFGSSLTPSKTDKANMRDVLMANVSWVGSEPVSTDLG